MAGSAPSPSLREIPLGKTIILSVVTLSVYFWVQTWRNSHDIQSARSDGFAWWKVAFVLGFFTFGLGFVLLYVLNFIQVHKMRTEMGTDDTLGIIALVLAIVTLVIGAIVWAVHWNNTVQQATGTATPAARTGTATA